MNKPNKNKPVDTKNTVAVVVTGGDGEWVKWVKGSTVCLQMENKFLVVTTLSYMASQVGELVKNSPANAGDIRNLGQSLGQEDPLEKEMETHPSIIALGNPKDRRVWQARVHGAAKSWTQLSMHTL